MDLAKLGYTQKWMEYGFLTEEALNLQLVEFDKGEDPNTEHYRYRTFQNWLASKTNVTDNEIQQFIELSKEDTDAVMAGSAVRELFTSSIISEDQFELIRLKLPAFGDWTRKLILREVLTKRLQKEEITTELFNECFAYKKEFKDNRLMVVIIEQTNNKELLAEFASNGSGKRMRTLAQKKLNKVIREEAKNL
jgi:hypothetical protein